MGLLQDFKTIFEIFLSKKSDPDLEPDFSTIIPDLDSELAKKLRI
jgi:hypothetical protein